MAQIKTIQQLIDRLNNKKEDESYLQIMKETRIPEMEYEKYYSWDSKRYTRNVLSRTKDYELLLICWEAGQKSTIHDYDSQEAWIHPISGKLREERYRQNDKNELEQVSSVILTPTEFSFMDGPGGIHRYVNDSRERTVTLHLYAEPVDKWTVYSNNSHGPKREVTGYNSVMGKRVDQP